VSRSRLAEPAARPPWEQRRLDPKFWSRDRARGTAADTEGSVRAERRELDRPRRARAYGGET